MIKELSFVVLGKGEHWCIKLCILALVLVLLLGAAVMDYKTKKVYDLFWIAIIVLGAILFLINGSFSIRIFISLLIYCAIQELLMGKVYGRADSHAFCAMAYVMAAFSCELETYVCHMLICAVLLTLVQGVKKNINCKGKLNEPVAMIPYIVASLIIMTGFVIIKRIVEYCTLLEV